MKILFIHRGFPGQFKWLLNKLISRGDHITAIIPKNSKFSNTNVDFYYYELERGNGADTDPLAIEIETKVLRGRAVSKVASRLKIVIISLI